MSLTQCRECGVVVSSEAKACLKCGAIPAKSRKGCWIVLAIIGSLWMIGTLSMTSFRTPTTTASTTPATSVSPAESAVHDELDKTKDPRWLKTRAGKLWRQHKEWHPIVCETIAERHAFIGMTAEQVRAAWGRPESINTTQTIAGRHEQWVYGGGFYAYFEDGTMTSYQSSQSGK